MRESIDNNRNTILLIIVIILAAWNIFNTNGIKTDVKLYKEKIEDIQSQVESVQLLNDGIDTKISIVKEDVNSITKDIHSIDKGIIVSKQRTNEKIISVDVIGNVELERLFTDRYSN